MGQVPRSTRSRIPSPGAPSFTRRALVAATGAGVMTLLASCGSSLARADAALTETARIDSVTPSSVGVSGGATVTVRGDGLSRVAAATVGGTTASVRAATNARVTLVVPPAADFVPTTAAIELRTAADDRVASSRITYALKTGIDRQLNYVLKYWQHYNPDYEALSDNDCVDFASQGLLARGWAQQDDWVHSEDVYDSGAAWVSSTAFREFMLDHPELGTALTDEQRGKVKLGDIVQFNWDGTGDTGDRDHTGTVTRITTSNGRTSIFFAGHTDDSDYRSVDTAITKDHPGGVAYYWSLA